MKRSTYTLGSKQRIKLGVSVIVTVTVTAQNVFAQGRCEALSMIEKQLESSFGQKFAYQAVDAFEANIRFYFNEKNGTFKVTRYVVVPYQDEPFACIILEGKT
jgi:hypothetical protein